MSSSNPFMTDEVDDDEFLYGRKKGGGASSYGGGTDFRDPHWGADPGQASGLSGLQQQKQNSMNAQMDMTRNALASIYDSEAMGVATAEELVQQGEQLDNVERKLDNVNADLKTSQKHLNNIKSVFGGIKNWWRKDKEPAVPEEPERKPNRHLQEAIEREENRPPGTHPALRLRSEDGRGFYEDDGAAGGSTGVQQQKQKSPEQDAYEDKLSENLDEMSSGMARLKMLAMGLGDEIETQNDQLDRITGKVDSTDERVRDKNAQMRRILGK